MQYKSSCIRSCLHHSDWRTDYCQIIPNASMLPNENDMWIRIWTLTWNTPLARMTLRSLFPKKNHGTFFMLVCSAILVKCFAVPTSLLIYVCYSAVSYLCPLYTQCNKRRSDHSMQFRRFCYYRILNDVLRTIIMHNTLSFTRQWAEFFRITHRFN